MASNPFHGEAQDASGSGEGNGQLQDVSLANDSAPEALKVAVEQVHDNRIQAMSIEDGAHPEPSGDHHPCIIT
jgi:hypothetical protein